MKRMTAWFEGISLSVKYFLMTMISISLIFLVVFLYSYSKIVAVAEKQIVENAVQISAKNNQLIDSYFESVQSILFSVAANTTLLDMHPEEIENLLDNCRSSYLPVVKSLFLVMPDETVYANRQIYYDIMGNSNMIDFYRKQCHGGLTSLTVSEPYYSPHSGYTVAVAYPMRNNKGVATATIIVELDIKGICGKSESDYSSRNQTYFIMSSMGNMVVSDLNTSIFPGMNRSKEATDAFLQQIYHLGNGVHSVSFENCSYIVAVSAFNRFHWCTVQVIDETVFYSYAGDIQKIFIDLIPILILIIIVGSIAISISCAHPIKHLAAVIDRVDNLEVGIPVSTSRKDEIGCLIGSYNKLLERTKKLIHGIREAESQKAIYEQKMLQYQIRPHFLSNTLFCIENMAYQQRLDAVHTMIRALIELLRYSIKGPLDFVLLSKEFEYTQVYMHIQEIRYENRFNLRISINDDVRNCLIPKLIIQPLVENAIFHGLIPMSESENALCILSISAKLRGSNLILRVFDNGVGMDAPTRERILTRSEAHCNDFEHIGIDNVLHRLKIIYGNQFSVHITSSRGLHHGTLITLKFPCKTT